MKKATINYNKSGWLIHRDNYFDYFIHHKPSEIEYEEWSNLLEEYGIMRDPCSFSFDVKVEKVNDPLSNGRETTKRCGKHQCTNQVDYLVDHEVFQDIEGFCNTCIRKLNIE